MRAPTGWPIGRKWAQGVAERYEAALAGAEEVLEGVTAGRQDPTRWDEENLHRLEAGGWIWEADVPETGESEPESGEALEGRMGGTDETERVPCSAIAFSTYDGPVNRKGHPRLRPFREHAGMIDRDAGRDPTGCPVAYTQSPEGEHRMSFLGRVR